MHNGRTMTHAILISAFMIVVAFGSLASTTRATEVASLPASPAPAPAAAVTTTSGGVFSAAQAARGQAAYKQSCAVCHQDNLSGGDQSPSLAGDDFMLRWEAQSVGDLIERTRVSMPLDNPGSLSARTAADIVAYLLQANAFPAGAQELTSVAAAKITIQRK